MYDIIGIGVGVFNLSLTSLLPSIKDIKSLFLEKKRALDFHSGCRTNSSRLQMSFIKDLVTPVDPTNPFSFLNYLVEKGKIYPFVSLGQNPSLNEFNNYLIWVANKLQNLKFNFEVIDIKYDGTRFCVLNNKEEEIYGKNIVLGCGLEPNIPDFARKYLGDKVIHSSGFLPWFSNHNSRKILVIGGGQSGADIINHILHYRGENLESLIWVNSDSNLWVLDDTPFVNDTFTPDYSLKFYHHSDLIKTNLLKDLKNASDGISPNTILSIASYLYEEIHNNNKNYFNLFHSHRLTNIVCQDDNLTATIDHISTEKKVYLEVDSIVLCTGYCYKFPKFLGSLASQIYPNSKFKILKDYSLVWPGAPKNRIYVQNLGVRSHGIADPNIGLAAWRNDIIINSFLDCNHYRTDQLSLVPETYF